MLALCARSMELDLELPCAINEDEAAAKFDKKGKALNLTLPRLEPVKPAPLRTLFVAVTLT